MRVMSFGDMILSLLEELYAPPPLPAQFLASCSRPAADTAVDWPQRSGQRRGRPTPACGPGASPRRWPGRHGGQSSCWHRTSKLDSK